MKNLFLLLLVIVLTVPNQLSAQSKNYTPWQLSFMPGYAIATSKGVGNGFAFYSEFQYHLSDRLSVGFRAGAAFMGKMKYDTLGALTSGSSLGARVSYLATGNYYFQHEDGAKFRPFVGIGLGYANSINATSNASYGTTATQLSSGSGFGGVARVGADFSHVRFNIEYDINPKSSNDTLGKNKTTDISNNYIGIFLGFYIGGGSSKSHY